MSSGVATTARTPNPVWISTSSIATTFVGSAIATTSMRPSSRPIGTSSRRLAMSAESRLTAARSMRWLDRSTNSRPSRSAIARPRCSAVITPRSTISCSALTPASRAAGRISSTWASVAKPMSTTTSVSRRNPPAVRVGGVCGGMAGPSRPACDSDDSVITLRLSADRGDGCSARERGRPRAGPMSSRKANCRQRGSSRRTSEPMIPIGTTHDARTVSAECGFLPAKPTKE